jgi:hypothetical protein
VGGLALRWCMIWRFTRMGRRWRWPRATAPCAFTRSARRRRGRPQARFSPCVYVCALLYVAPHAASKQRAETEIECVSECV